MPATSKSKNPRGIEIVFTEADHKYLSIVNGKEINYTSVTGLVGSCFPQFDPTGAIAERCAKKEGITVAELKERWAAKGRESCRLGTRMHECCEDIELGRELRNKAENEIEQMRFNNAIKMAKAFRQKLDIIGVEKLVFDDRLQIAGTIDLLGKSRKLQNTYVIIDHKSNQKISNDNKYKKFALDPISHVPDTNFHHYGLQLNTYAYILKFGGYVPKDAKFKFFLNHVTPEAAKLIELPDMQSEVKDIVIDFLLKKRS